MSSESACVECSRCRGKLASNWLVYHTSNKDPGKMLSYVDTNMMSFHIR